MFENENVYYYYRKEAAKTDPRLRSRETASEALGISAETLRAYETGITKTVPAESVLQMSMLYNAPELRNHYCLNVCPIGEKYVLAVDVKHVGLDRLTLRLLNSLRNIVEIKEELVEIVADGVITGQERPSLTRVLETLDSISLHTQELRLWTEKHLK